MKNQAENQNYIRSWQAFFWKNRWFFTIVFFLIATLLSAAKPVVLPDGGAVTYFSLFFLWLITFFFGPKHGLWVSVLFGFAKLFITWVTGEYINYTPMALVLEYPVACGAFAIGGLLPSRKDDTCLVEDTFLGESGGMRIRKTLPWVKPSDHIRREPGKLRCGYLLGVLCMGICYIISAVLFYPPDRVGFWPNLLYCIKYDMSYLAIEAGITLLVLLIPQIPEAVYYLKHVANTEYEDPTLKHF